MKEESKEQTHGGLSEVKHQGEDEDMGREREISALAEEVSWLKSPLCL